LSSRLRSNKIAALVSGGPDLILTANIGCQVHLAAGADLPVSHWITAVEARLSP
jgi:glycolate oxidase iron-sulfur subunit